MPKVVFTEEVCQHGANPYEAVRVASEEARRLNQVRLMANLPEGEEKVTTLALNRLISKEIVLSYDEDEKDELETGEEKHGVSEREEGTTGN